MKHLLTLAALLVSTLSLAQFTPYNPDADNDQFVGAQDLLAFLPLFGEDWDLDSLNIYALSELQSPDWCQEQPGWCAYFLTIPQDADIIYHDVPDFEPRLILPDTPKPIIFFGIGASDIFDNAEGWIPNPDDYYPPLPEGELLIVANRRLNKFSYALSFNGEWYFK